MLENVCLERTVERVTRKQDFDDQLFAEAQSHSSVLVWLVPRKAAPKISSRLPSGREESTIFPLMGGRTLVLKGLALKAP